MTTCESCKHADPNADRCPNPKTDGRFTVFLDSSNNKSHMDACEEYEPVESAKTETNRTHLTVIRPIDEAGDFDRAISGLRAEGWQLREFNVVQHEGATYLLRVMSR